MIEWLGLAFIVGGAIVGINFFITRALIKQELERFSEKVTGVQVCDERHKSVSFRLSHLEAKE